MNYWQVIKHSDTNFSIKEFHENSMQSVGQETGSILIATTKKRAELICTLLNEFEITSDIVNF